MNRFFIALCVGVAAMATTRADDHPVKMKLDAAKTEYREQVEKLKKSVLDALEKKENAARETGDKKTVDQIKAERDAFVERDVVPKSVGASDYTKELAKARATIVAAYEAAIKDFTKTKKDDDAAKTEDELKAFRKEIAPKTAASAKSNDLIGTFQGQSGSGGLTEIWTIKKDDGKWSVKGIFKKDDKEVGSFHGQDYRYVNSVLLFKQIYDQKPVSSWADGTILGCQANKEKLVFRWQNSGSATGAPTTLTRVKE